MKFSINGTCIGAGQQPYVVAEMSANHNGSIDNAIKIIDEAKKCGADAIKMQTYKASTITLKSDSNDFKIKKGLWAGKTLYELYSWAHTPWEWHQELFDYASKIGITIFSSPFDASAVDFLEKLNTPAYKIASFEAIDLPLIKYVAGTGKPIIISTGMANEREIEEAIQTAKNNGCKNVAVLHCISSYPADPSEYNLITITDLIRKHNLVTGLSDHTLDNVTAIASVALGSSIIEKHFTLDRNGGGPDDSFSLEPKEMHALCRDVKLAWHALGRVNYEPTAGELNNIQFRRSLYFVKDMQPGDVVTLDCIRSVRPGFGVPPKYLDSLLGKKVSKYIKINTPVTLDSFLC